MYICICYKMYVKSFITETDYTKYLSLTYKCLKLYVYKNARIKLFYKC